MTPKKAAGRWPHRYAAPMQFVTVIAIAVSAHVASGAIIDAMLGREEGMRHLLTTLVPFLVVVGLAMFLQRAIGGTPRHPRAWWRWQCFGVVLVLLVSGSGSAVDHFIAGTPERRGWLAAWLLVAAAACWTAYGRGRKELFAPRTRYTESPREKPSVEPRRHLIVLLSHNQRLAKDSEVWPADVKTPYPQTLADLFAIMDARRNQEKPPANWNWEIPFRSLVPHLAHHALGGVTLVASSTSVLQVREFTALFDRLVHAQSGAANVDLYLWRRVSDGEGRHTPLRIPSDPSVAERRQTFAPENGFDFENFDTLTDALRSLIETLKEERKLDDSEIQIDVTGGQKPTSIVAAAITFRSDIAAQYVCTNKNETVVPIDVVVDPALFAIG